MNSSFKVSVLIIFYFSLIAIWCLICYSERNSDRRSSESTRDMMFSLDERKLCMQCSQTMSWGCWAQRVVSRL